MYSITLKYFRKGDVSPEPDRTIYYQEFYDMEVGRFVKAVNEAYYVTVRKEEEAVS